MNNIEQFIIDCVVIGNPNVGKTTLCECICRNIKFNPSYNITIGVDYFVYRTLLNNYNIKLNIWDTAGQENFKSIIKSYYKKCAICLLVYDISSLQSFEDLNYWYNVITEENPNVIILVVGNKIDKERIIKEDEINKWVLNHNVDYMETSVKNNISYLINKELKLKKHLKFIFDKLLYNLLQKYNYFNNYEQIPEGVKIINNQKDDKINLKKIIPITEIVMIVILSK